jgi:hypothetical protein
LDGDSPILDFVSKTPPFRALSISPRELALLEKALHLSLFINGWNEVGCDEFRAQQRGSSNWTQIVRA